MPNPEKPKHEITEEYLDDLAERLASIFSADVAAIEQVEKEKADAG